MEYRCMERRGRNFQVSKKRRGSNYGDGRD
jgi:hypothetical protein